MLSAATLTAIQVYGISIVVSLIIAIMIRVLVKLTTPKKRTAKETVKSPTAPLPVKTSATSTPTHMGTPEEIVAAISGALTVVIGPHRILGISQSNSGSTGSQNQA